MELINKERIIKTSTGNTLFKILLSIWNNEHFIIGVFAMLKKDEQKQKLINLIEKDGINDSDTIILASLDIAEGEL